MGTHLGRLITGSTWTFWRRTTTTFSGFGGYMDNPPAGDGQKVVIVNTDHLWGIGGDYVWVWKSFTCGLNPIFMDGYDGAGYGVGGQGFNFNDPQWVKLRANLGYAQSYAQQVNLAAMTPRGDLCSTGYCLANPTGPGAEFINAYRSHLLADHARLRTGHYGTNFQTTRVIGCGYGLAFRSYPCAYAIQYMPLIAAWDFCVACCMQDGRYRHYIFMTYVSSIVTAGDFNFWRK